MKLELNRQQIFCGGLALGAGLMYVFDPQRGRRRRAMLRDQTVHALNVAGTAYDKTTTDLGNRAGGALAELGARLRDEPVSDEALAARVRARLGRLVAHPHAIGVTAHAGRVTLRGPVFASEIRQLLHGVAWVRGVTEVDNQLEPHDEAEKIPALQNKPPHPGESLPFMQNDWSPTTRFLAGATGGGLALLGLSQRGWLGAACEAAGLSLLARGLTNRDLKSLAGVNGARGFEVRKTIHIDAPVEKVFEFWTHHENFPKFMSKVREVRDLGEGRYQWKVAGPAGLMFEWEGTIVEQIPGELQRWESAPGSIITQSGVARFQPGHNGGTQIDIHLVWQPPAGALGHAFATLFGADPKSDLDADLMRMKSYIETGHAPRDAAQPAQKSSTATTGGA